MRSSLGRHHFASTSSEFGGITGAVIGGAAILASVAFLNPNDPNYAGAGVTAGLGAAVLIGSLIWLKSDPDIRQPSSDTQWTPDDGVIFQKQ